MNFILNVISESGIKVAYDVPCMGYNKEPLAADLTKAITA
jgi:hypothetical protein